MRGYVIFLAAGVLVGIIDGVLDVRSPAPPVVALIGLLGMLIGEHADRGTSGSGRAAADDGQRISAAW